MRNTIRKDVLFFAIPAFFVYSTGMAVSTWDLIRRGGVYTPSVQTIVGLALVAIGLTIAIVAAVTLRRFYSATLVIRKDHQLVTRGVYRFARHPIYLGALMVSIGVPVCVSSLYGLLIMVALIPLVLNRVRMEEKMLGDEFGDAYRAYQEATSKLIPFIY